MFFTNLSGKGCLFSLLIAVVFGVLSWVVGKVFGFPFFFFVPFVFLPFLFNRKYK